MTRPLWGVMCGRQRAAESTTSRVVMWSCLLLSICELFAWGAQPSRKDICSSDSDCVRVFVKPGMQLTVDELDFSTSTVNDVLKRLPEWFGPKPAELTLNGQPMKDLHRPLASYGITVPGTQVNLRKADGHSGERRDL